MDVRACSGDRDFPICDPLTRLCVQAGAACTLTTACDARTEYCSPHIKKCAMSSTTSCDPLGSVGCSLEPHFPVCDPLTKLCVKPGHDCEPTCWATPAPPAAEPVWML